MRGCNRCGAGPRTGGLAQFERALIQLHTGEGRARVVAQGVKMGHRPKLTSRRRAEAIKRRDKGKTLTEIAGSYNVGAAIISRLTL